MCFHQCKTKHTNIFEAPEMPEVPAAEEEEEEAPEEVAPVAPEAPPAEGMQWCSERARPSFYVSTLLSALCPSVFYVVG